jgi:hypothetical protein
VVSILNLILTVVFGFFVVGWTVLILGNLWVVYNLLFVRYRPRPCPDCKEMMHGLPFCDCEYPSLRCGFFE